MESGRTRPSLNVPKRISPFRTAALACLVALLSYLAARLGGALILRPEAVWPLWPGCAFLVAVLLLVPRRIWPLLILTGLTGFVLYDLQADVPIPSIVRLILADIVEVTTAALCLSYFFNGVPQLDSVKALAKYSFVAVILAPFAVSLVGAFALPGNYWTRWKISFFSEALALLTVTPAILGWFSNGPVFEKKSRAFYLEATALSSTLALLGYVIFVVSGKGVPPALLYSLVPILLWASLRFGPSGVSSSVIVIAFLSIWGAVHGRGPFTQPEPISRVLLLQLFLLSTATPFMVLAVLVEERQRAEEELRESASRECARVKELKTLLDAAPITILIAPDAECKRVTGNRTACQVHHVPIGGNFSKSAFPTEQLPFRIMRDGVEIPPEELPLQRAATTGIPVFGEISTLVFKDGAERHMIGNTAPLFGEDGKPRGAVGAFVDITERKRAEEALKKSEEKFSKAFRGSPTLVTLNSTRDGRYIEVNETFERITGYRRDEVIGRTSSEVGFWDDPRQREKLVKKILVEGSLRNTECRFRGKNGGLRIGLLSADLIEIEGETCSICVIVDITERKRAEDALRESEERLRLAVQAGRMYAFEWDAETDVIVRSGECKVILDWMDDPTRDTGRQFVSRVHPEDRAAYAAGETFTPGNSAYQTSYRVVRPDGSVIWLEARGHALFDDKGKILRIMGMVADVTARKRAERELSELGGRLIHAQEEERTRIARELHDDLSQRMALLQIKLEQFQQNTAGLSTQAQQQLHKIAEGASEVSSSIHDLSHQLHPPNLDTLGLVVSLRRVCKEFSEQHNLQVQFVCDCIPGQIPKDVTLCLFRVVQEALRNVVKHSGATEARVELSGHGDRIDLCISDSGRGFNPESTKGEGGLGLVSMRERLRLIGGDLTLESEPLRGTRIRVRTPLLASSAQVTSEPKVRNAGA